MSKPVPLFRPADHPRVVAVGCYRDPLGMAGAGMLEALRQRADLRLVETSQAPWSAPGVLMRTLREVRAHDAELVHILDARHATVGRWMRAKKGLPATVSLTSGDVRVTRGWPRTAAVLPQLDLAFVTEPAVAAALRTRAPRLDVTVVPPAAQPLPWPRKDRMAAVTRALKGVRPGRLVIGVPWPADRRDLRWFRDAIMPLVDGGPLCLVFGAPSRRYARLLFGARGMETDFRVYQGRLDGDTIAAVARCVDAFVVPSGIGGLDGASPTDLALALAMGGVPVVTCGEADSPVLAHERNAFVVEPDERAFVHTLSQVMGLPAVQRHALGEDFARYTLRQWTWDAVAEVYAERFAALVGRPQIPADLRAA
ncbi:MAG: glycosyltransferase [Chloroflexi bacterium]|nr:glycosyltransferase [Chloroflexota bacterium]